MTRSELREIFEAAAAKHDADIYFYSGPIDDDGFGELVEEVTRHHTEKTRVILILTTGGGSANAGYQIGRLLQRLYSEFWLFCPSACKSAGTLVALGAHRLIMDNFSELGPLDVQLMKEDELFARKSGLLAKATFDALADEAFSLYERLMISIKVKSNSLVSFRLASELAANMTSNLLSEVYAQINPDVIGSEKRDLEIAVHYGLRLANYSGNAKSTTVDHLVSQYPSHDFIIDDEEARELFKHVDMPSEELYKVIGVLGQSAYAESRDAVVCALTWKGGEEQDDDLEEGQQGPSDSGGGPPVDDRGRADRPSDSGAGGEHGGGNAENGDDGADRRTAEIREIGPRGKGRRSRT